MGAPYQGCEIERGKEKESRQRGVVGRGVREWAVGSFSGTRVKRAVVVVSIFWFGISPQLYTRAVVVVIGNGTN